ncbi:hypothetical protein V7S76_08915 [Aquirufa sp. ROCK2-A2]
MKNWNFTLMLKLSLMVMIGFIAYHIILYQFGIIPLGGKKAPSFILLLIAQWYLAHNRFKNSNGQSIHFLNLFANQYVFVVLVGILSAVGIYYFYQQPMGIRVLNEFISLSVNELNQYKSQILLQEDIRFFEQLLEGVRSIDANSIAKDDFSQKIALAFLPNLLISLYYKQN